MMAAFALCALLQGARALVALLGGAEASWRERADAAHARAHRYSWIDAADRLLALIANAP